MPEHFADQLAAGVQRLRSPVVVGLDPRWEMLPEVFRQGDKQTWRQADTCGDRGSLSPGFPVSLSSGARAYETFCCGVIDVVASLVPAVKVQAAFFEELGPAGMAAMAAVIDYAHDHGLLVIVDGKRGDIGSTAEAYARGYLGVRCQVSGVREESHDTRHLTPDTFSSAWQADALTVNPYLGDDSLEPFVRVASERGAGVFVLVKTSNPGSGMLQDVLTDDGPLSARVAAHVESLATQTVGAHEYGSIGAVVGATYPKQLTELRAAMPHTWFLVPGYGSQGAGGADVAAAFDDRGLGAIVNSSRGIIFAHTRPEYADRFGPARWQEAVEAATRDMMAELRTAVPAIGR